MCSRYKYLFRLVMMAVFLGAFHHLQAQQSEITIKGKVIGSSDLSPLPGVSILLRTTGTPKPLGLTDEGGRYEVKAPADGRLEFRFISYETSVISIKGRREITVSMQPSATSLKEAVVVGYQKRTKETITGAVSRITAKEIQDVPVSNIEQLLQGKVPGLNIQATTGAPGFRGSAAIRGLSQIMVHGSGNDAYLTPQSPLYVIDGVPVDANSSYEYGFQSMGPGTSPLSLIPPEDIQSVDVMKDAEATALYGSKGANGVIVITTKQGNSPVPIVRYSSNLFFDFPPQLRKTTGGKAERALRVNEIFGTGDLNQIYNISDIQFLSDSLNPFFNNSTNWQGLYYQVTSNQQHNIQVSGGNQELNYKANFNYYDEKGVIKNTGFNRYTVSLNVNFRPTERLQVAGYLSAGLGKKLKGSGNGLTDVGAGTAIASSLLPGPSYFINVGHFTDALYRTNDARTYNVRAYLNASYEVVKHIRLSANTSYDFTSDLEDTYTPALANSEQPLVYGYTGRHSILYNRSMITYNNIWEAKHSLYVSLFSETTIDQELNTMINRGNGPNDSYHGPLGFNSYYSGLTGVPQNGGYSVIHSQGLAANIQYDYMKKYVINLNYRQDGNSYAGLKNRWAKSPSLGLRWNFNKENLLKDKAWLDYGDLRFSYGINLRPTTNIFASQGWYDINGNYNGVTRISPHLGLMPNPSLKPEKVKQYNYGFDVGILSGRFGVTFDYYAKTVYDMLYEQDLGTATGFQSTFTNDASVYNYGYELQFTFRPFRNTSKVNWTVNLNAAVDKNVLLRLPGGAAAVLSSDGTIINRVGYNALSNFLFISEGVYRTDDDVPVDPVTGLSYQSSSGAFYQAGDMKFKDVDGNYVANSIDQQVAGSPVPRVTGGFSSYLTYKNYSINFNGSFTLKRDLLNNALSDRLGNIRYPTNNDVTQHEVNTGGTITDLKGMDYWKAPGDVSRYPYPYNYLSNTDPYNRLQTLFQEDGSYFKLNALTVGYTFDRALTEKINIRAIRLYTTVTNLFVITRYTGPNPEAVSELGRDGLGTYPISRTLAFGLNVEF